MDTIKCRKGRCYDTTVTLKKKVTMMFDKNSEIDLIEQDLLFNELNEG